jgi:Zn-dependent M32 family carboxypeptidase
MSINKVKNYLKEYSYLKSIQSLLHWDMETMMPHGAIEDRAARQSYIQGKIHSKGRSVNATDIVGKLDVKDYLSYLTEKFKD